MRVYIESSEPACRSNSIQCANIYRYLERNSHIIVNSPEKAKCIIIQSCGYDQTHEIYTLEKINNFSKLMKKTIYILGCLNKINPDFAKRFKNVKLINNLSELDFYFYNTHHYEDSNQFLNSDLISKITHGTENYNSSIHVLKYRLINLFVSGLKSIQKYTSNINIHSNLLENFIIEQKTNAKFYIEISRGCTNKCNYCVIKNARGPLYSRPVKQIISDIQSNLQHEKYIFLVADDCGSYGLDINTNLFELIKAINENFPEKKIDFNYLHPKWLEKYPRKYLELFEKYNINSLNLSIQSGSQKILKKMNRHYSIHKIIQFIYLIKVINPNIVIRTHFLIGFPGESFKDFLKTMCIVNHFEIGYPIKYSDRKGAVSFNFNKKVPEFIKILRTTFIDFFIFSNFLIKLGKSLKKGINT